MNSKLSPRSGWTTSHLVYAALLVAAGVLVTFEAWKDIALIGWRDTESSQVLLVPIVAAWLAWVRADRLRFCEPRGSMLGPIIVAMGWGAFCLGFYRGLESIFHAGAVMIAVGCLLSVMGRDLLVQFFPAFAVLVFLVPVPGTIRRLIAMPMQTATAATVQSIFEVFGLPVERAVNQLTYNGHVVNIAEGCNGMRMVFTLVLVSYTFAFITPLRGSVRLLILIASPLLALVCNIIRLIPTVWMFGHTTQENALTFHDWAGWAMVVVAFFLLLGIVRLLQWAMIPINKYNLAHD